MHTFLNTFGSASSRSRASVRRGRGGFTLVEMLVVITVIVLVSAVLLPAFTKLIESNNYASAVNQVSAALGNARSLALKTQKRTGVVFLWDAQREVCTLQVVVEGPRESGKLTAQPAPSGSDPAVRLAAAAEIMYPAPLSVLVELPRGIGVFGLTSAIESPDVDNRWDDRISSDPNTFKWYAGECAYEGNTEDAKNKIFLWLFPRNDPRLYTEAPATGPRLGKDPWDVLRNGSPDEESRAAVRHSQSFFVQFSAEGTIVAPRRSGGDDVYNYYLEYPDAPVDRTNLTDAVQQYDEGSTFDPEFIASGLNGPDEIERNPEVLLRTVEQIAIADVGRLSQGVGVPRAWLARAHRSRAPRPAWLTDPGVYIQENGSDVDRTVRAVSRWVDLNAEIISFNRYSGQAIRRNAL